MIDSEGFRANVGIILSNGDGRLFWARRVGQSDWQFPQGGIRRHETPQQAMYRELNEEIGLCADHVEVVGCTQHWLRYRLPQRYVHKNKQPLCIGQKQKWFMLHLIGEDGNVRLDRTGRPEFDQWRWVSYWFPLREVVHFKRKVYTHALNELAPLLFGKLEAHRTRHSWGRGRSTAR